MSKRRLLVSFILTTAAGIALHFVYQLFPHVITALFSPVNESVWEHVKLLFWPYLIAALLLTRGEMEKRAPWILTLLILCGLMLGAGYLYYIRAEGTSMAFGLVLYVILMAVGFVLPSLLRAANGVWWADIVYLAAIVLGVAILLFTFLPPWHVLFTDITNAGFFTVIPY